MTDDELEELVRRVAREEVEAALARYHGSDAVAGLDEVDDSLCESPGGTRGVCIRKKGHKERHKYGTKPVPVPQVPRLWKQIESYRPEGAGYALVIGSPVTVKGGGRRTKAHPEGKDLVGTITRIEEQVESGKVNIEIKPNDGTFLRMYTADRVLLIPPKKPRRVRS